MRMARMPTGLSRRHLLTLGAGGLAAIVLPLRPRPAHALPLVLDAAPGTAQLLAAGKPATAIWGFNGGTPGPVLRVRQGDRVKARLVNRLPQPTTIHWHGIRIANAMDGVPHMTQHAVEPGQSFDYDFVAPDAGTYWYHPHERSYEQVARGLFGVLVVEEKDPPQVDQDLVVLINDWRLSSDGSFNEKTLGSAHDRAHAGRLGNTITINGRHQGSFPVRPNERVRVRLVNASSARVLRLRLEQATARLIAIDGQPIPPTATYGDALVLAPGNRADLMLDVVAAAGSVLPLTEVTGKRLELARFEIAGEPVRSAPLVAPIELAPNPVAQPAMANARTVDLVMTGGAMSEMDMNPAYASGPVWFFNGVPGMQEQPLFSARRGETIAVRMLNDTAWPHAMHFHGHHFRIISRSGDTKLDPYLWDTVLMEKGEEMVVALSADNPGKWMIHCHMLDHQAAGMDTWFEVGA
jgi:FtsP/CotA-like multicopper oxidase with cupredoxin domain